jgi:BirA family transcriptional regulator, biotin operon repressor / biotin---[acetyl-CoA-carboxylase] ligase
MSFQLGPRAAQAGHRLTSFDTIGSTNTEALSRLRGGERGALWVAARAQTTGRGRRDRTWSTAEGFLAASLLMLTEAPLARAATLGFVAGLALGEALQLCAPDLSVALKWPNDVLVDGKKLAGILLESEPVDGKLAVVIGIGVNVVSAPQDLNLPATSLADLGRQVRAEDLFAALTDAWIALERIWDNGRGLPAIRTRWLDRAFGLGAPVSIETGNDVLRGMFETLDDEGRLILRAADRSEIAISAGDVHFGVAATVQEPR